MRLSALSFLAPVVFALLLSACASPQRVVDDRMTILDHDQMVTLDLPLAEVRFLYVASPPQQWSLEVKDPDFARTTPVVSESGIKAAPRFEYLVLFENGQTQRGELDRPFNFTGTGEAFVMVTGRRDRRPQILRAQDPIPTYGVLVDFRSHPAQKK